MPFSVAFASIVATSARTNVIPKPGINLSSVASLVSGSIAIAAIFAPGMYISSNVLVAHPRFESHYTSKGERSLFSP